MTQVLRKPTARVVVPEQVGQPHLPASYDCYPPPPAGPPQVPPPGGGNGSGPPGGGPCQIQPVYESLFLCNGYPPGNPLATPPCLMSTFIVGYVTICP